MDPQFSFRLPWNIVYSVHVLFINSLSIYRFTSTYPLITQL